MIATLTRRGVLLGSGGVLVACAPLFVFFPLFDGHVHLVADDLKTFPRVAAGPPPPAGARPGGGGLPPGVGGQPGGKSGNTRRADPDVERVVLWMAEQGIEAIAAVQKRGTYGLDNRYIIASSDKYPAKLAPVVVLDAEDARTPDTMRELVRDHGLAGLRLTGGAATDGSFPWLNSPRALSAWTVAEQTGLVMDLMITAVGRSSQAVDAYIALAQKYPSTRLVLDHVGYPSVAGAPDYGIDATHQRLAQQKNIYFKVSTINFDLLRNAGIPEAAFVQRTVDVYGADHVLWGSDLGNSAGSYAELSARMKRNVAMLSDAQQHAVLHDTGRSVFVRGGTRGLST